MPGPGAVKSSCFGPMASTMPGPRTVKSSCFGPMASTMPGPESCQILLFWTYGVNYARTRGLSNPLVLDLWRQLCQDQELSNPLVLDLWRQLCQDQELSNPLVLDLWRQLCQDQEPVKSSCFGPMASTMPGPCSRDCSWSCYCTNSYRVNESYVEFNVSVLSRSLFI